MKTAYKVPEMRHYEDIDTALYAAKEFIRDGFVVELKALYSGSAIDNADHAGVLLTASENVKAPSNRE
jgi:hypothetical protein